MPDERVTLTGASEASTPSPGPVPDGLPSRFSGPKVQLINSFKDPFNNAVATARTCYSASVVLPEHVDKDSKSRAQRDAIAVSIYKAGHHTTLQHSSFQFVLENVSRHFIWSFLHSHPFYNSEQVSQRYVTVGPDRLTLPPLKEPALTLFREAAGNLMEAYGRLTEILLPSVRAEYKKIFPLRNPDQKPWAKFVQRKSQEVARYVLPVATQAHLYHTVSGLTLHRYHRLCQSFDTPWEQRIVVDKMIAAVREVDPLFTDRMEDPLPLESTPEYRAHREFHGKTKPAREFIKEFDARLKRRSSCLVDYKVHGEKVLAQAVRSVFGVPQSMMSDEDAIDRVLNPARNRYLGESLNLGTHSKLCRTLSHMHFTFAKKISHTADSQDQRHRMTPASRPVLSGHFVPDQPDYITPLLIRQTPEAKEFYDTTLTALWGQIERLMNDGVPEEFALYLLPNAVSVRFDESGDLLNFHHKWTKRLCYTAQEEIWKTSQEEVLQVQHIAPRVAAHLGAPCQLRSVSSTRPFCPEGDRFCGVVVWKNKVEDYERLI
ncbi:MAG: FAD-dependent thymidylate synthase [Elusimicrobia bacterium]|jgi:flavin-dependent thymidylate synthase|nr:FAD-dependent thymidylate synthase [Elusimicrobiota bacterium]